MKQINWFFYNETKTAGNYVPTKQTLSPELGEGEDIETIAELQVKNISGKNPETYSWAIIVGGDFTEASLVIESKFLLDGKEASFVPYCGVNFPKFNLKDLTDDAKGLNIFGSNIKQKFFTLDIVSSIVLDTRIRLVNTEAVSNFYLGIMKINK